MVHGVVNGGENGRSFLGHVDFHALGMVAMIRDLKESNGNDLREFNLYLTSGMHWV